MKAVKETEKDKPFPCRVNAAVKSIIFIIEPS